MKNKLIFVLFVFIVLLFDGSLVNALDISIENYYPVPVEAGDYFTIWLKILNNEVNLVENTAVRFKDSYPFSLDPTEEREIAISKLESKSAVTKKFKVRVDKESKEGDNNIVFEYKDCASCMWKQKSMPITVVEFQTRFDVVLQEITSEGVFIAIANIGKNSANAITVSIPEQDYFTTDLTSATIVGNLESGDYTIAAFKILPKQRGVGENQEFLVKIDYTDPFGVRRTVTKSVLLNPSSLSRVGLEGTELYTKGNMNRTSSRFLTDIWFWTSIILALLLAIKWIKAIHRKSKQRN